MVEMKVGVNERESIERVTLNLCGRFNELIEMNDLGDGACLVYEKCNLFPLGFLRVNWVNIRGGEEMGEVCLSYKLINRELNDGTMRH